MIHSSRIWNTYGFFLIYEILLESVPQNDSISLPICRLYLFPLNVGNKFGNLDSTFLINNYYVEMIISKRRQDDEVQVKLQSKNDT